MQLDPNPIQAPRGTRHGRPQLVPALVALLLAACAAPGASPADDAAWQQLVPATDLDAFVGGSTFDPQVLASMSPEARAAQLEVWSQDVAAHWHLEGDELVSDGRGPNLVTRASFGDFELELDWMIQPRGDSGIYLRGYPQVQIWDPANPAEVANGAPRGSGALWNNDVHERFPLVCADRPPGEWNHMRIVMRGERVDVWLNGEPVTRGVTLDNYFRRGEALVPKGPIHLQTHGSEVRFRAVRIRPVSD